MQNNHLEFCEKWAAGEILTSTSPADAVQLKKLLADYYSMRNNLEIERGRLAACGVAANQNTKKSITERLEDDSPYWSASYDDVCRSVNREMSLRDHVKYLELSIFTHSETTNHRLNRIEKCLARDDVRFGVDFGFKPPSVVINVSGDLDGKAISKEIQKALNDIPCLSEVKDEFPEPHMESFEVVSHSQGAVGTISEKISFDGNIHVMPDSGPKHFEKKSCWCKPFLDYKDPETNKEVYIHTDTRSDGVN